MANKALRRNAAGCLIGTIGGVERTSAHTYRVASASQPGETYLCYIESLSPIVGRCSCTGFVIHGDCKHVKACVAAERWVSQNDPDGYREERAARRERKEVGVRHQPYLGGAVA